MIEIKGLYKSFGDAEVLRDINLSFKKGKVNMIIGQSGSGKSVLTKCTVGLLKPTEGEVLYNGKDFFKISEDERREIRKQMGMLFQGSALFDSMSVLENVLFPLRMFSDASTEEIMDRAMFCLKRVKIAEERIHLFPSEISGGMQKRVGIARAIAMKPAYLFCDEPNSGLDPKTSIVIDKLIQEITYEYDITTIVISHDMNSVIEIGDHIHFLYNGSMWWGGDKRDILTTQNKEVNDFVYASSFMAELKEKLQ
ncbi:ABC transporter ATP-binding protein [Luteibaculum oceani]|uniref:ATP-binding cassette domain-containing protein n=1 Tax=Luteibaculum oceani TaxID=1294296 RepID=A0A5C6V9E0_9FLAO|nr:ATP-binding cassette domain-containing protein [Luteibaculum oceani]TXC81799.1 ATP-binding cassette domain-containing protein [Luteibaculum oceani]